MIQTFLKQQDFHHAFSNATIGRGKHCFKAGQVLSVRIDQVKSNVVSLISHIDNHEASPHEQHIIIRRETGHSSINGDCTCNTGFNCKHVVAALLHFIEYQQQPLLQQLKQDQTSADKQPSVPENQWAVWYQQYQRRKKTTPETYKTIELPAASDIPRQPTVLYLLQPLTSAASTELFFSIGLYQQGMNGWQLIKPLTGNVTAHPALTREDQVIIGALKPISDMFAFDKRLQPTINSELLKRLITTGRAYLVQTEGHKLFLDKSRHASLRWAEVKGHYKLETVLENTSKNWISLATTPTFYIDETSGACGIIEQPLDSGLFDALRYMPGISTSQFDELSGFIQQEKLSKVLPLPSPETTNTPIASPKPKLLIQWIENHYAVNAMFVYGQQHFLAGDTTADTYHTFSVEQGHSVTLKRDIAQEEALTDELLNVLAAFIEHCQLTTDVSLPFALPDAKADPISNYQFFSQQLSQLTQKGWTVDIKDSGEKLFIEPEQWSIALQPETQSQVLINLTVNIDGEDIPLLPLLIDWLKRTTLQPDDPLPDPVVLLHPNGKRWITLPAEDIAPIIGILVELYDRPALKQKPGLSLPKAVLGRIHQLTEQLHNIHRQGDKALFGLGKQLSHDLMEVVIPPKGLKAQLRDYQHQGLNWLQFLRKSHLGGILADDMGLGKTLQTLAHILYEKEQGRLRQPALIVAPTSLLENWQKEANHFTPQLTTLIWHGTDRMKLWSQVAGNAIDMLITSYGTLQRDAAHLASRPFYLMVLDEAQSIKNARSKAATAVRLIDAQHRLCLTGTPVENHLEELWALFDFLTPGLLGNKQQFRRLYRKPIEQQENSQSQAELTQRIRPFLLRRTKAQVAKELPAKTEMTKLVCLTGKQRKLYATLREIMADKVSSLIAEKGLKRSQIEILDILLKLRQVCCDPQLVKLPEAQQVTQSAKREMLIDMLEQLVAEDRKILVFSQFTSMLQLIEKELNAKQLSYVKLTGQTRNRQAVIEEFQQGEIPIFLLSLKAGGVGLNLTAADTVIHYDPWWNPAVQQQATDRAYRIGQDKPVFVYRLVTQHSIEEQMLMLQAKKQQLADALYNEAPTVKTSLTDEDLALLLQPFDHHE
ncbi:DEAD/DEAH box helicase [Zooshikella ganghwensis]|uniref:DEAD/DEAH box helicase n=1 Tax=Zooshikella ganghwensis TaxID=202772 RepID=UPI0003FE4832|nr:DEAD/DEAH box helicase [Zooshikella ganghwensis]